MPKRAPLHPILRFIYLILRIISWIGVYVFYRRRIVIGREHLNFDGPAIVIVNHPSTLMDVLNPCIHLPHELFFLANYGLFKHPVSNWLLTRLYCIPVKRREDVSEGETRNNDAAFEQSFEHMAKKGVLFIAAEGVSWMERWVRPFKTGAARIAFGAETRHNWQLDVKFLPIGLSYSAPNLFRSEVIVHFGAPVYASAWQQAAQSDPEKAYDDCMLDLQQRVRALVLDTRDEPGQVFIERLEKIMTDRFPPKKEGRRYFNYRKQLIDQNLDNSTLREATGRYFSALESAGVDHETFAASVPGKRHGWYAVFLALGLPFFLAGYTFWFLPTWLPWLLVKRMKLYIGYDSNVKMLAGLFTFPPALWAAFHFAEQAGFPGWSALIALIGLGYFAEQYQDIWQKWRRRRSGLHWKETHPQQWDAFHEQLEVLKTKIFHPGH